MAEDEALIALIQSANLMDDSARTVMRVMERVSNGCDDDRLRRQIWTMHASAKEVHKTAEETKRRCKKRW